MEKPLLFVVTLLTLAVLGASLACVRPHVREGYEDEAGFHFGSPPPQA
jgi:hypothetical protein